MEKVKINVPYYKKDKENPIHVQTLAKYHNQIGEIIDIEKDGIMSIYKVKMKDDNIINCWKREINFLN